MPLTQVQLDAIEILMNGEGETPRGVQQLLSEMCERRDKVLLLTGIHDVEVNGSPVLNDAEATGLLLALRHRLRATAQELVDLLA